MSTTNAPGFSDELPDPAAADGSSKWALRADYPRWADGTEPWAAAVAPAVVSPGIEPVTERVEWLTKRRLAAASGEGSLTLS